MNRKIEFESIIWYPILNYAESYNTQEIKKEELTPTTKTLELFPSKLAPLGDRMVRFDDEANNFGALVYDSVLYYRVQFGLPDLRIEDIEARTEFEHFPTLNDLFLYFRELVLNNRPDLRDELYG